MLRLLTRDQVERLLWLIPLIEVLDFIGVHHLKFAFTEEDPYDITEYTSELAWLDRHLVCDDEGIILRVL